MPHRWIMDIEGLHVTEYICYNYSMKWTIEYFEQADTTQIEYFNRTALRTAFDC